MKVPAFSISSLGSTCLLKVAGGLNKIVRGVFIQQPLDPRDSLHQAEEVGIVHEI